MRLLALPLCMAMIALAAPVHGADPIRRPPNWSWGKAGITLEQYRADAIGCARAAVNRDLADTDPGKAMVLASKLTDNTNDPERMALVNRMIAPERQFAQAEDIQYRALDTCLTARGYRPFHLTAAQRQRMKELDHGTDERRAYLFSLASDPAVLAAQAE